MKLSLFCGAYYRVKRGQRLRDIARTFAVPSRLIALRNALTEEVEEGQVLLLPQKDGNLYCVLGGESKSLLCGSPEQYEQKNGTTQLYPMQDVLV